MIPLVTKRDEIQVSQTWQQKENKNIILTIDVKSLEENYEN